MNGTTSTNGWVDLPLAGVRGQPLQDGKAIPNRCAFTVDLEDWHQSVFNNELPVSDRFVIGLDRILALLDETDGKATFFVLGNIAQAFPQHVRRLVALGHEVQTHGLDHTCVHRLTRAQFIHDVTTSKKRIEDITGQAVTGYRAPRFSIDQNTAWALDALRDCGFWYDSSIFPMRIRGYGVSDWPVAPQMLQLPNGGELLELPVSVLRRWHTALPIAGGGYFRLLPLRFLLSGLQFLIREGLCPVIYCHPHEFDPEGMRECASKVTLRKRLHQGLGRKSFGNKIRSLLTRWQSITLRDYIRQTQNPSSTHARRDLIPDLVNRAKKQAKLPIPAVNR